MELLDPLGLLRDCHASLKQNFQVAAARRVAGPGGNFFANSRANSSQSSDTLSSSRDCDNLLIKDPHRQRNRSE